MQRFMVALGGGLAERHACLVRVGHEGAASREGARRGRRVRRDHISEPPAARYHIVVPTTLPRGPRRVGRTTVDASLLEPPTRLASQPPLGPHMVRRARFIAAVQLSHGSPSRRCIVPSSRQNPVVVSVRGGPPARTGRSSTVAASVSRSPFPGSGRSPPRRLLPRSDRPQRREPWPSQASWPHCNCRKT